MWVYLFHKWIFCPFCGRKLRTNLLTRQEQYTKGSVIEFRRTLYWTGNIIEFNTLTTYIDSNSALRLSPFYRQDPSYNDDSMAIIRILSARRRIVPNLLFPMAVLFSSLSNSSTASWITKFIYWSKSSNFPRTDLPPLNLIRTVLLI